MLPTLQNGDWILVLRYFHNWRLHKNQVIVLNRNQKTNERLIPSNSVEAIPLYIKRIVALPRETIVIDHVDGMHVLPSNTVRGYRFSHWFIPENHYLVRSDNTPGDLDS